MIETDEIDPFMELLKERERNKASVIIGFAILSLATRFVLGWTHYVTLLTISNPDERRFYEIEARENSWGARELELVFPVG